MSAQALTRWGLPWLVCAATLRCADPSEDTVQPDAAPSACTDDRFGPSLPDLPAADLDPGTFSDLVLCADQTDWFALAAGPGFPVTVRASGEAPLRLVMADGAGVVLAEDVDSVALKNVAKVTEANAIEQITTRSFRLVGAKPAEGLVAACTAGGLDHVWLPEGRQLSDFGLFVTDMDSTLINIECIDEIADMQGLKGEVAAITEAAMQGEIDFRESLTRRVALLAGLPESALAEVFDELVELAGEVAPPGGGDLEVPLVVA